MEEVGARLDIDVAADLYGLDRPDLIVEGDVEAVLALRNAIDNAQLDLTAEIAATLGPFGEPLKRVMRAARPAAAPAATPFGEGGGRWN